MTHQNQDLKRYNKYWNRCQIIKKNWGSEICAVNEKESINKVLNSNLSNSSLDKTEQILTKNTEEKEHMESTTKETYTR